LNSVLVLLSQIPFEVDFGRVRADIANEGLFDAGRHIWVKSSAVDTLNVLVQVKRVGCARLLADGPLGVDSLDVSVKGALDRGVG